MWQRTGGNEKDRENRNSHIINIYMSSGEEGGGVAEEKEIMGERSRKDGERRDWLQRQQQAHLAQFIFSFPSLTSPLSPLECRLADLHLALPTAPVCERGRRRRTTSSPLISSTVCFPPSESFTHTCHQAAFPGVIFTGETMTTMKAAIAGTVLQIRTLNFCSASCEVTSSCFNRFHVAMIRLTRAA